MIRLIGIAILIWGLITQPLMAAIPMTDSSNHSEKSSVTMSHDMNQHVSQSSEKKSKSSSPCHEKTADEMSEESCDKCERVCIEGMCGASCVPGGAGAISRLSCNSNQIERNFFVISSQVASPHRFPSRIFHPPKHA